MIKRQYNSHLPDFPTCLKDSIVYTWLTHMFKSSNKQTNTSRVRWSQTLVKPAITKLKTGVYWINGISRDILVWFPFRPRNVVFNYFLEKAKKSRATFSISVMKPKFELSVWRFYFNLSFQIITFSWTFY